MQLVATVVPPYAQSAGRQPQQHVRVAVPVEIASGRGLNGVRARRLKRRSTQPRPFGYVRPAVSEISKQSSPRRPGGEQIEQAVVVVVHELRRDVSGRFSRRVFRDEPSATVTHRKDAGGIRASKKEV